MPEIEDWDKRTKLAFEREMLGLYVSDHPLHGLEHILESERDVAIGKVVAPPDGPPRDTSVAICGMITAVTRKTTKNGDPWAIVAIEDLDASMEVLLFPKVYGLCATVLATDTIVRIRGNVRTKDDSVEMIGQEVTLPNITEGPAAPVVITLPATRCTPPLVQELRHVLQAHPPGVTEVRLRLEADSRSTLWRLDQALRVTPPARR